MKHKQAQYTANVKALTSEDGTATGEFEAVVAVFDNVDNHGDRLKSTAFDSTLERWREKGTRIPVILSHGWDNPFAFIGSADPADVKAIPGRGLYVKGQIEHMEDNPTAAQVYRLMKSGLLSEFSFGYTVAKGGETKAADGAYDLTEVNLIEFGPCLKGVNPDTELLAVKSMRAALVAENLHLKSYVDVDVPGSYEETQEALAEAISAVYPAPNADTYVYVNVIATFPDRVVYQVCTSGPDGSEDETYQADYTGNEDTGITIGEPVMVDFVAVPETAEKAEVEAETKAETEGEAEATPEAGEKAEDGQNDTATTDGMPEAPEAQEKAEEAPEVKAGEIDLMLYESALENLELGLKLRPYSAEAREAAAIDAQLEADLNDLG